MKLGRTWMRLFLVVPLLVSVLSQTTSVQAQDDPTKLVIWCPSSVGTPVSGKNGCTPAFTKLDDLQAALLTRNPKGAGTIWIGKNYNSSMVGDGNQYFNGNALTNMAKSPLTIKGGWNGLKTGTLDLNAPSTLDGAYLTIGSWKGAVSLRNLVVKNAAAYTCALPAAVCVGTDGGIKIDRVQALTNPGMGGVVLDNSTSTSTPPAPITVTNSQFIANGFIGLEAYSKGTATLSNIWAQDNAVDGVYIANTTGTGNVVLKGTNTFLRNDGYGLVVRTNGTVTATHLIAHANQGGDGVDIVAKKAVTITGSGRFKGNGGNGLYIDSGGPVTARNLTTTSNNLSGLFLVTSIPGASTQAVTLGNVNADLNDFFGIEIYADGKITMNCSNLYGNTNVGLFVRDFLGTGPAAALKQQGYLSYRNGVPDDISTTPVVSTTAACP